MAYTIEASNRVYENVRSYFESGNGVQNYNLLEVVRKLGENNIYRVMAQNKKTKEYAVWTCWNEYIQSMNFGHYNLTKKTAEDILYCRGEWDY